VFLNHVVVRGSRLRIPAITKKTWDLIEMREFMDQDEHPCAICVSANLAIVRGHARAEERPLLV
jgi:hypothetical protein